MNTDQPYNCEFQRIMKINYLDIKSNIIIRKSILRGIVTLYTNNHRIKIMFFIYMNEVLK